MAAAAVTIEGLRRVADLYGWIEVPLDDPTQAMWLSFGASSTTAVHATDRQGEIGVRVVRRPVPPRRHSSTDAPGLLPAATRATMGACGAALVLRGGWP